MNQVTNNQYGPVISIAPWHLSRIDAKSDAAVTSLRNARALPNHRELFIANAAIHNQSAGLEAWDLGLAELIPAASRN